MDHRVPMSGDLFPSRPAGGAVISEDGRYRYALERRWGVGDRTCVFVMLNPSTADAEVNDPTIRRCMRFAQGWRFDRLVVVNLFALRTPSPVRLKEAIDPIGPDNDAWVSGIARDADLIVCAWGAHGNHLGRDAQVQRLLCHYPLYALGITKGGSPRHPLYLKADSRPRPWRPQHADPAEARCGLL